MPVLIVFPGLLALVMMAEIEYPDMALPWVIKNVLPVGISGLMFVAIIAALQSSIDSSINSTALIITRHSSRTDEKPQPESDLKIGRLLTLALLLSAMCIAPYIGNLGGIFNFLQSLVSVSRPHAGTAVVRRDDKASYRYRWDYYAGQRRYAGWHFVWVIELNMLYVAFFTFATRCQPCGLSAASRNPTAMSTCKS